MIRVFKDSGLQRRFETDGYVTVPFFNAAQVERCRQVYGTLHESAAGGGFFTSTYSKDEAYRKEVDKHLTTIFLERSGDVLHDFAPVYANFMAKSPGQGSFCPLHQDWAYVDETESCSVNIWCPLVDTTPLNGCLKVVPGSHLLDLPFRGRNIFCPYNNIKQHIVDNYLAEVRLKAGEAVIFNARLLHYSSPNQSGQMRVAASLVLVPKNARLLHYQSPPGDASLVEVYEPGKAFFTDFGVWEDFGGLQATGQLRHACEDWTAEDFDRKYAGVQWKNLSFWRRIKHKLQSATI